MSNIYVVAPNRHPTGGVELLHQFVDAVNTSAGTARIVYFPFHGSHSRPKAYEKYACPQALVGEADKSGSVVIIPETLTHLIRHFSYASVFVWWLSVDNYFGSLKLRYLIANRLLPFRHWTVRADPRISHLAQSQYAIDFLRKNGVLGARLLTDYLNPDFITAAQQVDVRCKKDIVLYNPAKGMARTRQVLGLIPAHIKTVALEGMTRAQMVDTLASAKVYIDFGNHPGKDRIPREAAIMRCCVLTNRRGSAANSVDVPISDEYKIDDTCSGFALEAARQVSRIIENYPAAGVRYESYRQIIQGEQRNFQKQVREIISEVTVGRA